jgi:hypothetical protein
MKTKNTNNPSIRKAVEAAPREATASAQRLSAPAGRVLERPTNRRVPRAPEGLCLNIAISDERRRQ